MTTEDKQTSPGPAEFLRYTAATDIGMRREENQDSYGVIEREQYRLFIVADGMGGVQGGAAASNMAVNAVEQYLKDKPELTAENLCEAISIANKMIFDRGDGDASLSGMGTTFVALAFVDKRMFVVNVGDSRAYLFRKQRIKRLTEDHTLVMELVKSGTISAEQAGNHPVSHMLTRCLGPASEIEIDCYLSKDAPIAGDFFLLCSDGLYNMVTEEEMLEMINQYDMDKATELLIDLANQRGGSDNITLILIKVDDNFSADPSIIDSKQEASQAAQDEAQNTPDINQEKSAEENGEIDGNIEDFDPFAIPELEEALEKARKAKPKTEEKKPSDSAKDKDGKDEEAKGEASKEREQKQEAKEEKEDKLPIDLDEVVKRSPAALISTGILAGLVGGVIVVLLSKLITQKPADPIPQDPAAVFISEQERLRDAVLGMPEDPVIAVPKTPQIRSDESVILSMRDTTKSTVDELKEKVSPHDNLERRKEKVMNLIEDTKLNIKRLEEDSAFNVLSALVDEETNFNDLRDRLRNIRSEIDNSARKLAIWHGRKTRIKEADLTNLASEVAVTSEDVRLKKEEFEQASWNYLKEAEVLRYMPADLEQRKKVDELIAIRNQKIENMAQAVNQAIESEISEAENLMTEHILEKERLQDEVDITDNRIEFLRILLDGSDELKEKKRNELEGTLLSLNSELKELEKLFPAAAASAQEENDSADLSEVEVTAEIADAESQ